MPARDVAQPNEIFLGGTWFPTTGPVRTANITVVPNPIILGDTSSQTETQVVSQFIMPDASSGIGINRGNVRIQFDRAWTSEAETRFSHQITLPNLITDLDRPAGETGQVFWIGSYLGATWAIFGLKVYSLAGTAWTLEHTLPEAPTAAVVFQDRLWITMATAGMDFKETPNKVDDGVFPPGSWQHVAENSASLLYVTGERLFRWYRKFVTGGGGVGTWFWFNYGYTTPYTPDAPSGGGTVPTPWALQVQSGLAVDVFAIIPMIQLGGNLAGTFYVATDGVYYNTTLGLTRLAVTYGPLQAGHFGRTACQFGTDVIIPTGELGLVAYRPGTADIRTIGLDQEDGVPAAKWGVIDQVVATQTSLYALVTERGLSDTAPRDLAVYAYDGHWHHLASRASGLMVTTGTSVQGRVLAVLPDGVYVGYTRADGNPNVKRIDERPRPVTPKQIGVDASQTRYTYAEGPILHVTPWFDFGSEIQAKLALKLQIQCEATTTETVEVWYGTDLDDATWTQLGTITTNGLHILPFNGARGAPMRLLRLKYVLRRATGVSHDDQRPLIDFSVVEFMRLLPATYGFAVELDLTRTWKGKTATGLLAELTRLADPKRTPQLVEFAYRDGQNDEPQTHWVKISRMTGQEYGGRRLRGVASYMLSVMEPYPADAR